MNSSVDMSTTNSSFSSSTYVDPFYDAMNQHLPSVLEGKIHAVYKRLAPKDQSIVFELLYTKFNSSTSIKIFLQHLIETIGKSSIESWKRKIRLFVKDYFIKNVDVQFNEVKLPDYSTTDSSEFLSQFDCPDASLDAIKFINYVEIQINALAFSLNESHQPSLIAQIQTLIQSSEPKDKRELLTLRTNPCFITKIH